MKKNLIIAGMLAAFSTYASAEGIYAFGNIGLAKFDHALERSTTTAVGLGYKLDPTFSVELGYHDLGGQAWSPTDNSIYAHAVQASAIANLPFNDNFNIFVRAGLARVNVNGDIGNNRVISSGSNDVTYGIGANYKFSDKFSMRLDYNHFRYEYEPSAFKMQISAYTVGTTYNF
jgi:opacity protein-like surface antigen